MEYTLSFVKCSGAGNDFVLIDNLKGELSLTLPDVARAFCSRPFGVGADGLLVLEPSTKADFRMLYYNADGSYGGMCGNGGRCAAMFAYKSGNAKSPMDFEALDFVYHAEVIGEVIRLSMKNPTRFNTHPEISPLLLMAIGLPVSIDTGSPHLVVRVADVDRVDVMHLGRTLRNHPSFSPEGANVNFVEVVDASTIKIRTYERGVESETFACGTGSVASGIVSVLGGECAPPISVLVRSGETVIVNFREEDRQITHVSLQGSAHILFQGIALFDDTSRTIYYRLGL